MQRETSQQIILISLEKLMDPFFNKPFQPASYSNSFEEGFLVPLASHICYRRLWPDDG